jgi:hypothetical protein
MYEPEFKLATPYRYYQNGIDVTWWIMNNLAPPMSERFFEVTCR